MELASYIYTVPGAKTYARYAEQYVKKAIYNFMKTETFQNLIQYKI
jgi:hypothetical protein